MERKGGKEGRKGHSERVASCFSGGELTRFTFDSVSWMDNDDALKRDASVRIGGLQVRADRLESSVETLRLWTNDLMAKHHPSPATGMAAARGETVPAAPTTGRLAESARNFFSFGRSGTAVSATDPPSGAATSAAGGVTPPHSVSPAAPQPSAVTVPPPNRITVAPRRSGEVESAALTEVLSSMQQLLSDTHHASASLMQECKKLEAQRAAFDENDGGPSVATAAPALVSVADDADVARLRQQLSDIETAISREEEASKSRTNDATDDGSVAQVDGPRHPPSRHETPQPATVLEPSAAPAAPQGSRSDRSVVDDGHLAGVPPEDAALFDATVAACWAPVAADSAATFETLVALRRRWIAEDTAASDGDDDGERQVRAASQELQCAVNELAQLKNQLLVGQQRQADHVMRLQAFEKSRTEMCEQHKLNVRRASSKLQELELARKRLDTQRQPQQQQGGMLVSCLQRVVTVRQTTSPPSSSSSSAVAAVFPHHHDPATTQAATGAASSAVLSPSTSFSAEASSATAVEEDVTAGSGGGGGDGTTGPREGKRAWLRRVGSSFVQRGVDTILHHHHHHQPTSSTATLASAAAGAPLTIGTAAVEQQPNPHRLSNGGAAAAASRNDDGDASQSRLISGLLLERDWLRRERSELRGLILERKSAGGAVAGGGGKPAPHRNGTATITNDVRTQLRALLSRLPPTEQFNSILAGGSGGGIGDETA